MRDLARALTDDPGPSGSAIPIDDRAVDLAISEGVAPLLGARISRGSVTVPESRRGGLRWEHQMCLAASVVRAQALASLAELYRRADLPAVLLKGMALVQSLMDPGERSMIDVDVLVPARRWHEACDRLIGGGFVEIAPADRPFTARHDYVRSFHNRSGVTIEVHRFVCEASLFHIDYDGGDGLFARARPAAAGLLVPDDCDLMLTLAAHAAKHTFDLPLRSYLDGVFLLRRTPVQISAMVERARRWGMTATLASWMRALRLLTPRDLDAAPEDAGDRSWRARVGRLVWSRTRHASPWQRFVRLAWLTDDRSDWMRHVATRVGLRAMDALQTTLSGPPPPVPPS